MAAVLRRLRQEQHGWADGVVVEEEEKKEEPLKVARRSFARSGPNRLVFDDFTLLGPKIFFACGAL